MLRYLSLIRGAIFDHFYRSAPLSLRIRTDVNLEAVEPPAPQSERYRNRLREIAKKWAKEEFPTPCPTIRAGAKLLAG
jgi:hypothetical protein